MAAARFEIFTDRADEWRFRLVAPNNEIITVGEGYTTKQNCVKGIDAVRRYAPDAAVVER
ncbi:MAG: DUF1508 domain-containing protein [Thermoplasmatota archaeon]